MTDPTDSPTSAQGRWIQFNPGHVLPGLVTIARLNDEGEVYGPMFPTSVGAANEALQHLNALESANAALRAELEAANKKAALADEIGRTIRESMRRGDLDDWLASYDALERESGGTP